MLFNRDSLQRLSSDDRTSIKPLDTIQLIRSFWIKSLDTGSTSSTHRIILSRYSSSPPALPPWMTIWLNHLSIPVNVNKSFSLLPLSPGLGNAFLSHISACDAIFHLCRKYCFVTFYPNLPFYSLSILTIVYTIPCMILPVTIQLTLQTRSVRWSNFDA